MKDQDARDYRAVRRACSNPEYVDAWNRLKDAGWSTEDLKSPAKQFDTSPTDAFIEPDAWRWAINVAALRLYYAPKAPQDR
jgi:hypothetical protein